MGPLIVMVRRRVKLNMVVSCESGVIVPMNHVSPFVAFSFY